MDTPPVNVPDVPGVPAVNFADAAVSAVALLTEDAISFPSGLAPQWGLYQDGAPAIVAESVVAFEYKQEWVVADFPVEEGAFESYDKVQVPFDVRLRFAAGGSEAQREALLASIEAIAGTTTLFDAVTPEQVYPNVNVIQYAYRRTASAGLGLLQIDVWCAEVRIAAGAPLSNTAQPSGASQVDGGIVQPVPVESSALPPLSGVT